MIETCVEINIKNSKQSILKMELRKDELNEENTLFDATRTNTF